jgi:3-methylcrotonyl-CoA carboxylase alpha subunit
MVMTIRLSSELGEWTAAVDAGRVTFSDGSASFAVKETADGRLTIEAPGGTWTVIGADLGETIWIGVDGYALEFQIDRTAGRVRSVVRDQDSLTPPMPATVVRIPVQVGDHVEAGDTLIVLEAMKMELPIRAPRASTVRAIHCTEGQLVQPGMVLVDLEMGSEAMSR